ncbi:MAG: DUF4175 domain-containing protein [Paenirhodobacter sp.]|uniref:DUF4175 domain-containing protein n=1 Tax=Paenirhodobacter sp. TaxID=1965326 RepID=UPI003D110159
MLRRARPETDDALAAFARPIALTRAAMALERGLRAFWPLLSFLALIFAALAFRLRDLLRPVDWSTGVGLATFLAVILFGVGLRRFRWPRRGEAVARLDATLPGRPFAALTDAMALGGGDPAARALWAAHRARMERAAAAARPLPPEPDLAPRDPFALRLTALTAVVVALIFGTPSALLEPAARPGAPGTAEAAVGPSWEGWAEPPRYTGKPGLYLNALEQDEIFLPEGTKLSFRFYGAPGSVPFDESVSSPAATPDTAATSDVQRRDLVVMQSGRLHLGGPASRTFRITMLSDAAPEITLLGTAERRADGKLSQPFHASDDYGVMKGQARITLDLARVDRRYGLATEPEPREALIYDLPLPISGSRADFTEALVEDAAKHAWANLPVKLTLEVEDGLGQAGTTGEQSLDLPGKRFFDPRAAALIEMRRDLLWSRANAQRSAEVLRAIANRPEEVFPNAEMPVTIHLVVTMLETPDLTPEARDKIADILWQLAEMLEDGGLADALAAMQQAQERLSEAIRNGASKDEIAKLMQELKEATDNYIKMLAERNQQEEQGPQFGQKQPDSQRITGDQIQQMMDAIQKLMEEGKMAEAQELLDQLARMMENLKVTQGQGGEGDMPGGQAMKDLGQTLRDQQKLSDDAFRDMQQPPGQGGQGQRADPDAQGQDGQAPGQQREGQGAQGQPDQAQNGQGQNGQGAGNQGQNLADRQRALRRELDRQKGLMPRLGGEAGDAARQRLDEAGRAMDGAEQALREGNTGQAIDRQADAIQALREGMRSLGEALAQEQGRSDRQGAQGSEGEQRFGDAMGGHGARELPRDPLGRATGEGGQIGSDRNLLNGEDVYRRARDLLDEIRRRSADRLRSADELDYLKRLLERF